MRGWMLVPVAIVVIWSLVAPLVVDGLHWWPEEAKEEEWLKLDTSLRSA